MSQPGLHKLGRIVAYILQENVRQDEMQGRYEAAKIIDRIIKEIKLGAAIKAQKAGERKGKGKR
jgi:hypothetical protein